jgi:porin
VAACGELCGPALQCKRRVAGADRRRSAPAPPVRDYELGLELTYQWKLADDWTLQPDLQYILHAGGHVTVPAGPTISPTNAAIPVSLMIGLRSFFKF